MRGSHIRFRESTYNYRRCARQNEAPPSAQELPAEALSAQDAHQQVSVLHNDYDTHELNELPVVKGAEFGFYAELDLAYNSWVSLQETFDVGWWGLSDRIRVVVESDQPEHLSLTGYHIGFVRDDDLSEVADKLLPDQAVRYPPGQTPLFVVGEVDPGFIGTKITLKVRLLSATGYGQERLLDEQTLNLKVSPCVYDAKADNTFFLDLWQHPCSWARYYRVPYFSEEHFHIIERYLLELSKLGQKVIDLVVTDMPWAGQKCYDVKVNASRLYEYNIVLVKRDSTGLVCDFSHFDRYIDLAYSCGITAEINLFGLMGNWHAQDFGSPLVDYRDPLRVKVFDEDTQTYEFITTKAELKNYITQIFEHLRELKERYQAEKKLFPAIRVVGDEPGSLEKFKAYIKFLEECAKEPLSCKFAVDEDQFLQSWFEHVENPLDHAYSLSSLLVAAYGSSAQKIGPCEKTSDDRVAHQNKGASLQRTVKKQLMSPDMTWYSCCFPQSLNFFLRSPLCESRFAGPLTYLWGLKGMLRWSYALFTDDQNSDIRYKPERWAAGDMLLVYPGPLGYPLHSLREKNLLYGIQDYNLLVKYLTKTCDRVCESDLNRDQSCVAMVLGIDPVLGVVEDLPPVNVNVYHPRNQLVTDDVSYKALPPLRSYRSAFISLIEGGLQNEAEL